MNEGTRLLSTSYKEKTYHFLSSVQYEHVAVPVVTS